MFINVNWCILSSVKSKMKLFFQNFVDFSHYLNFNQPFHFMFGAIHKLRLQDKVGRCPKMSTFCQRSYHRKCQCKAVGDQKKPKSCQRSLWTTPLIKFHTIAQLTPSPRITRFPLTQFPLTWTLAYLRVSGGISR